MVEDVHLEAALVADQAPRLIEELLVAELTERTVVLRAWPGPGRGLPVAVRCLTYPHYG